MKGGLQSMSVFSSCNRERHQAADLSQMQTRVYTAPSKHTHTHTYTHITHTYLTPAGEPQSDPARVLGIRTPRPVPHHLHWLPHSAGKCGDVYLMCKCVCVRDSLCVCVCVRCVYTYGVCSLMCTCMCVCLRACVCTHSIHWKLVLNVSVPLNH